MFPRALLFLAGLCLALTAQSGQDPATVRQVVDKFVSAQIKGLPGMASYTVGRIETAALAECAALEASLPKGARPWGRINVHVRCTAGATWQIFVPVQIGVMTEYLVTARPLVPGRAIEAADLARQTGNLAEQPVGTLIDPAEAIGKVAVAAVPPGRPLRGDMLRQPVAIQQGQTVRVISRGPGFEVANEGRAVTRALLGQVVQVRLASGQIVSGVAKSPGLVEIAY